MRKEKCDGVAQERGNRGVNEMKQLLDGRSDPPKKTESDILQLNETYRVLTDNQELDSDFKEIDCTSEQNDLLKNVCFANVIDKRKLRCRKKTYADAVSGTKNNRGNTVEDVQKIGKSALGKKDDKVARNESIDLESIYARLAEASSFYEDPPSPPNLCTDTSVAQNSSSSVNMSVGLDEDDNEVLKILNEFLNTSDEASVSPNVHRNRLDTFIHQKKNVTTTDNRLSEYFCSEIIFNLSNRVLTDTEMKGLEKGLDFAPIQKKLNELGLRSDFNGFCRRMHLKWHFGMNQKILIKYLCLTRNLGGNHLNVILVLRFS